MVFPIIIKAQEYFNGTIVYESTYIEPKTDKKTNKCIYETIIYASDKYVRIDRISRCGLIEVFKKSSIINLDNLSTISLFHEKKNLALIQTKEKIDSLKKLSGKKDIKEIIYTNKTKKILGYKCNKIEYQNYLDVYYTPKIILPKCVNEYFAFDEIEGLVLQYAYYPSNTETNAKNKVMTYTAKKIKEGDVDPNLFIIPDGYEIVDSFEDVMNAF